MSKTPMTLTVLLFTVGCSGSARIYAGDLTTTTLEAGKPTVVTKDSNVSLDIQRTATGGLIVDGFQFGALFLDKDPTPAKAESFLLGYSPMIHYTKTKGGKDSVSFDGSYTSATSECSDGYCHIVLKGHSVWTYEETGTTSVQDITWDFSGLGY